MSCLRINIKKFLFAYHCSICSSKFFGVSELSLLAPMQNAIQCKVAAYWTIELSLFLGVLSILARHLRTATLGIHLP